MLSSSSSTTTEVLHSTNSMAPRMPYRISLEQLQNSSSLACGDSVKVSAWLHASHAVEQDLCVLFVFREVSLLEHFAIVSLIVMIQAPELPFHSARVTRHYEVKPILKVVASSRPSGSPDHTFLLNVEVENATEISNVQLTQITTMSPLWACSPLGQCCMFVFRLTASSTAITEPLQRYDSTAPNYKASVGSDGMERFFGFRSHETVRST